MVSVARQRPRSFIGRAAVLTRQSSPALSKLAVKALAAAREHASTFAGWAALCVSAWEGSPVAGWAVTGVAIFALDFHVRG